MIKKLMIGCTLIVFVVWGACTLLIKNAPRETGGEEIFLKHGYVGGYHPLRIGLAQVRWGKYSDESGHGRYGPIAELSLWRVDKPIQDELQHYEGADFKVHAGQRIQWDGYSLYVEQASYFPEFVELRLYLPEQGKSGS